jgi:predicted GTPase
VPARAIEFLDGFYRFPLPRCQVWSAHLQQSGTPVVAVCAVRAGCGKGAVSRRVVELLRERERRAVVVRHPMSYGDLAAARVQRFASFADLVRAGVTLEEREEYEPHLDQGTVMYAGVDYAAILSVPRQSSKVTSRA